MMDLLLVEVKESFDGLDDELMIRQLGESRDRDGADEAGFTNSDRKRSAVRGEQEGVVPLPGFKGGAGGAMTQPDEK